MTNFQIVQTNKRLLLIITALIWAINFRTTFKNIDAHMDLGSYPSLIFDPLLILIKNILCCIIHLILFFYSIKINSSGKKDSILIKMQTANFLNNQNDETFESENSSFVQIPEANNLNNSEKKNLLWLKYAKLISFIIIIYLIEEIYFSVANNHILDRLVVCMRNIGVLIPTFILSSLFIKKDWKLYKHQLFPIIIIVLISLFMIIFNAATVQRFKKIFNINFLYYFIIYKKA